MAHIPAGHTQSLGLLVQHRLLGGRTKRVARVVSVLHIDQALQAEIVVLTHGALHEMHLAKDYPHQELAWLPIRKR